MIRTYELKTEMNKSKKEKVLSVMKEYRKIASLIVKKQWEIFYKEGAFDKNYPIIGGIKWQEQNLLLLISLPDK